MRSRSSQDHLSDFGSELFERSNSAKNDKLLGEKVDRELRAALGDLISKKSSGESSIETLRLDKDDLQGILESLGYLNRLTSNNEKAHQHLLQAIWI